LKGELLMIDGQLTFFFKKSDVKTESDIEALKQMIHHMHHNASKWSKHTIQDVKKILNDSKSVYIGLAMKLEDNPDLKIYNFSGRDYKMVKLIHENYGGEKG
jgi:hypothetical protein